MTRAACQLILQLGTLGLAWRSVKSLKKPSHEMDLEILQLWSLLTLHKVYVMIGTESIISWFPLYYYLKMLILLVTLVPGTKFANFWFETLLVPAIDRIHEILDLNWRDWVQYQLISVPCIFIDHIFSPGLLSPKGSKRMKKIRKMQLKKSRKEYPVPKSMFDDIDYNIKLRFSITDTLVKINPLHLLRTFFRYIHRLKTILSKIRNIYSTNKSHDNSKVLKPHSCINEKENTPNAIGRSKNGKIVENLKTKQPSQKSNRQRQTINSRLPPRRTLDGTSDSSLDSRAGNSRVAATSKYLRRFSRDHQYDPDSQIKRKNNRRRTTSILRSTQEKWNTGMDCKQSNNSTDTKSLGRNKRGSKRLKVPPQLAFCSASARKNKYVRTGNNKMDLNEKPLEKEPNRISHSLRNGDPRKNGIFSSSLESKSTDSESTTPSIELDCSTPTKRKGRRSFGDTVRSIVTGDEHMRIRDYLFDLALPASPRAKKSSLPISFWRGKTEDSNSAEKEKSDKHSSKHRDGSKFSSSNPETSKKQTLSKARTTEQNESGRGLKNRQKSSILQNDDLRKNVTIRKTRKEVREEAKILWHERLYAKRQTQTKERPEEISTQNIRRRRNIRSYQAKREEANKL